MTNGTFDRLPIPFDDGALLGGLDGGPIERIDADYSVAVSPRQVAAGFGIVAGLLLLVVGSRRRRSGAGRRG